MNTPYRFPYVHCDQHGKQLSVAVCVHVIRGEAAAAHYAPPSDTGMGELLCDECRAVCPHPLSDLLRCICAAHVDRYRDTGGWQDTQ